MKIVGRMKDLRIEIGTWACVVGKIVKSRMRWAGHMVRMKGAQRNKEVAENKRKTTAKKIDLRKAEEDEDDWGEKTSTRERWKKMIAM